MYAPSRGRVAIALVLVALTVALALTVGVLPSRALSASSSPTIGSAGPVAALTASHGTRVGDLSAASAGASSSSTTPMALYPRYPSLLTQGILAQGLHLVGSAGAVATLTSPHVPPPTSARWSNVSQFVSGMPTPRYYASMAWDPVDHMDVLFGGFNTSGAFIADTWTFANGVWTNVSALSPTHPAPRAIAQMAFDPSDGVVVLMGGILPTQFPAASDTWTFSAGTWTNVTTTFGPVVPTAGGTLITDTVDGSAVLFGGVRTNSILTAQATTYVLHNGAWSNLTGTLSTSPPRQYFVTGAQDPADGGIVICCGLTGHNVIETWLFAGGTWTNITTTAGTPTLGGIVDQAMQVTYDAQDGVPIALAGIFTTGTGSQLNVWTYALIGGVWTNWSSYTGPSPVELYGTSAQDGAGGVVTTSGQTFGGLLRATDELAGPLYAGGSASPALLDVGQTVTFNGTIQGGHLDLYPYWSFGDGTWAAAQNTTHTYLRPGTFVATFDPEDVMGASSSVSLLITVAQNLTASAAANPSGADAGQAIHFTSSWAGGTLPVTGAWTFGDGATGSGNGGYHAYTAAGTYTATFWANDSRGTSVAVPLTVTVAATPTLVASATPATVVAGAAVTFAATPTGGTGSLTYLWNFTDGSWSSVASPTHAFATAGTYHVYVTGTDEAGVTCNASVTVTVVAPFRVSASVAPGGATVGATFTFTGTAQGGSGTATFSWDFGDASAAGSGSPATHAYAAVGNYTVKLTGTDGAGRTSVAWLNVTVMPVPKAPTTTSSSSGLGGWPLTALLAVVVLAIIAALFAVLFLLAGRKPKGPGPATAVESAPAPPPGMAPAEPAPSPPPPAPWSEGGVPPPPAPPAPPA